MARSNLREFQERLARRLAEAKTAEHRGLLGFQCGGENRSEERRVGKEC